MNVSSNTEHLVTCWLTCAQAQVINIKVAGKRSPRGNSPEWVLTMMKKIFTKSNQSCIPTIFLEKPPISGSTGVVYQSLDGMLKVKVSFDKNDSPEALRKEARM